MNIDHVFIDLLTTSPNPDTGQIIGIAAIRTDYKGNPLTAYSDKIAPLGNPKDDGYSEFDSIEWKEAQPLGLVLSTLKKDIIDQPNFSNSYIVVAEKADRIRAFLKASSRTELFGAKRAWLDILHIAWPLCYNDMVQDRTIDTLAKHFGVINSAPDTTTGNVTAMCQTYWALMQRYRGALSGEEIVRNIGGSPLQRLRSIVGF